MLQVYNTLTKKKEKFIPLNKDVVSMYVCGPTVYNYAHIGHAKTYIHFDIIARYLRYSGYKMKYVQNITDVGHLEHDADEGEDKIVKQAKKERIDPMELTEAYIREYFRDMDALNVVRPNISPRASAHIVEIIEFIKVLLQKGYAYEVDGSVYFEVGKFPNYGNLSGRKIEEMKAGTRIETRSDKHHLADFALWKKADSRHILQWTSPWGLGYPGWHIECSVMSTKYLGSTIDIHGGAIEISFPHHENEIAQSESFSGQKFVRYWLHGGLLTIEGQKMSKSLNNFITIKDILQRFHPETIRLFVASRHYRQPINFTEKLLQKSEDTFLYLQGTVNRLIILLQEGKNKARENDNLIKDLRKKYTFGMKKAMDDDFNTSVVVALLQEMTREVNTLLESEKIDSKQAKEILYQYEEFGKILGFFENVSIIKQKETSLNYLPSEIAILIGQREEMRRDKNWQKADETRQILLQKGVVLEDTNSGVRWRIKEKSH